MSHTIRRITLPVIMMLLAGASGVFALEPPTAEQLERYRSDGTLAARVDAAKSFGNHRMAARLAAQALPQASTKALPDAPTVLPSVGSQQVLTLLIAFDDMPGYTDPAVVHERIYGEGDPAGYPTESLTSFYRRSSYDRLEITGSTLGWYTTPYPRADVVESYSGRQELIKEVFTHFDTEGHDFSQYDNDGDGYIDYFVIVWTGAHGEWAEFWWGYQTSFWNDEFTVDGVQLSTYSWQWENYNWPGEFSPEVLIHETGHALGLPDYYDYDDALGPRGGVGGLDQMAGNWGDHNAYSKWVLGWLDPEIYNQDSHQLMLAPNDEIPQAAVLMHGDPIQNPFAEYFLVQHRRREGNDAQFPTDGLLIWHVDARLGDDGHPLYDNSYSEHKLLRLMEADSLEEIEMGGRADAGDFFGPGDLFDNDTSPNANRYDRVATNIAISSIAESANGISLQADLGSGCALWCDSTVSPNAWPGVTVAFNGSLDTANCDGVPSYGWVFGDGAGSSDTQASHTYVSTGSYDWNVTAEVEDAICAHDGVVNVCTDFSCWQWNTVQPLNHNRARHAAVALEDGRVFVVGGGAELPEMYDPTTGVWAPAAAPTAIFALPSAALLTDGRVLVVGGSDDEGDNTEIYDPATDTWSTSGQLNHGRILHSAMTLSDGRVLVAGGIFGDFPEYEDIEEVEVFDPLSQSWSVVGTLAGQRIHPALATLHDGRALIVGAREGTLFDPASDNLTRATPLPDEWSDPIAITLDDGRVLLCGNANGTMTLLWNPVDGRLNIAGRVGVIREGATATKLPNGFVLVTGGTSAGVVFDSTEYFDPTTLTWSTGSSLVQGRAAHTATLSENGTLILTGGLFDQGSGNSKSDQVETLGQPTSPPRSIGGRISP